MKKPRFRFADRTHRMRASIIREILKIAARPGVISFAGGLPAPELFPLREFERAVRTTLRTDGAKALQYGVTEGHAGLKAFLCQWYRRQGIPASPSQLLFSHGSQQGLDLVAKIFLNPGDKILVEDPTYLGAIQCFNSYQPTYVTVPIDESGMRPADVERALKRHKIRFIYVVPTFQNPAGTTMSLERRRALLAAARRHNVPIIEDDPYGLLRFHGKPVPTLYELAQGRGVVYLSTFSKLLSPGIRLGTLLAEPLIMQQLVYGKQASDLQNNTFIQYAVYHYCLNGDLDRHLPKIVSHYRRRAATMMTAIRRHFPSEVRCVEPQGGMFIWCVLPPKLKASEVFAKAIRQNVAFVDGSVFYANGGGENTMRLNFTSMSDTAIADGIARLGTVIGQEMVRKRV